MSAFVRPVRSQNRLTPQGDPWMSPVCQGDGSPDTSPYAICITRGQRPSDTPADRRSTPGPSDPPGQSPCRASARRSIQTVTGPAMILYYYLLCPLRMYESSRRTFAARIPTFCSPPSLLPGQCARNCTCQQKLDTFFKKMVLGNENLYKPFRHLDIAPRIAGHVLPTVTNS